MPIVRGKNTERSKGGTEAMADRLAQVSPDLLDRFQIFLSRIDGAELDPDRIRILWCHDTEEDPAVQHLANDGWRRFHRIVFVSNHQAQRYIERFRIPWSRTNVMLNAIEPITPEPREGPIKLIYTPTPHRGLNILAGIFPDLKKNNPDLELDVFSSFSLYGWDQRDAAFEPVFESLRNQEGVRYHGSVPNEEVRSALARADVFAYPSTWTETSCLCLMEAMSADLVCVHPNLGALYETAAGWTMMYPYQEDLNRHAWIFYHALLGAIQEARRRRGQKRSFQKAYADLFYSWESRRDLWISFLTSLLDLDTAIEDDFVYRVG